MTKEQIAIADMQSWVFRHAQTKWEMEPKDCADLFRKYDLLGYISDCYEILRVSSYQHALNDLESLLEKEGIVV